MRNLCVRYTIHVKEQACLTDVVANLPYKEDVFYY